MDTPYVQPGSWWAELASKVKSITHTLSYKILPSHLFQIHDFFATQPCQKDLRPIGGYVANVVGTMPIQPIKAARIAAVTGEICVVGYGLTWSSVPR
jgi:hypothetical protein